MTNIDTENILQGITVLGATGSIGVSTLDVISRHPDKYHVVALTANKQVDRLFEQCCRHNPEYAVMVNADAAQQLETKLKKQGQTTEVLSGVENLQYVAQLNGVDSVMAAIVGAAGLKPTLSAAESGKRVLLANKEALVMSGPIFMDTVRNNNAELLPIDSEHNAIFQCMPINYQDGLNNVGVSNILLTASGGPFRESSYESLQFVTPEQACDHPNWEMGKKISVDSATMMNKGLEVIEACWLFNTDVNNIEVVVHPQSVIHSMVEYIDGSVLAQLGNPDMRTPIANALAWPERIESGVKRLNIFDVAKLEFTRPDLHRFPCIDLAYQAMRQGGTCTTILNAANEVAVDAFLNNELAFLEIPKVIEETMSEIARHEVETLDIILQDDLAARNFANQKIQDFKAKRKVSTQ